jgi:hypothetical protein
LGWRYDCGSRSGAIIGIDYRSPENGAHRVNEMTISLDFCHFEHRHALQGGALRRGGAQNDSGLRTLHRENPQSPQGQLNHAMNFVDLFVFHRGLWVSNLVRSSTEAKSGTGSPTKNEAPTLKCDVFALFAFFAFQ